tara:strand:- start:2703 stop:3281 length:579 start_codon:yes stop_codon:yes gene_type:complete
MKNLFHILLLSFIVLTSCKKEEPLQPIQEVEESTEEVRIYGKWLLLDATMYVENLETHEKTSFSHFDANKSKSSLRYSGSMYDFEDIEQYETTWEFYPPSYVPGYGEFIFNSDTIQPYGFYVTRSEWTIVEHPLTNNTNDMLLGGSARPIEAYMYDYNDSIVNFYVQNAYENIDGWNCTYFTEMRMQKIEGW